MAIHDNSPVRKSVRWSDIQVSHNGLIYNIQNGHTNKRYVYWTSVNPYVLEHSDIIPSIKHDIILINNNGVATLYPSNKVVIGKDTSNDKQMIFNHMNNKDCHMSGSEKEDIQILRENVDSIKYDIELIFKRLDELSNK